MEITFEDSLSGFKSYFHRRADVADQLARSGAITDSLILGTTALDSLAKIWFHDFPKTEESLRCNYGGGISESIRLSQLLKQFAKNDPDASKVAVVRFAEDWKQFKPQDASIADQLLNKRYSNHPDELRRSRELPKSYLDIPLSELEKECTQIAQNPKLRRLAEEYEYGALLYTFYRCPLVHSSKYSDQTHGFCNGEEKMYFPVECNRTAIGFGPNLITHWIRIISTQYVQLCRQESVIPAENLDVALLQQKKLKDRWDKLYMQ